MLSVSSNPAPTLSHCQQQSCTHPAALPTAILHSPCRTASSNPALTVPHCQQHEGLPLLEEGRSVLGGEVPQILHHALLVAQLHHVCWHSRQRNPIARCRTRTTASSNDSHHLLTYFYDRTDDSVAFTRCFCHLGRSGRKM